MGAHSKQAKPRLKLAKKQEAGGSEASRPIRVVGLGASAGGLEALEAFFRSLPGDTGVAFVVVQHLDPKRPGMLGELLQRVTPMTVQEVRDGARIRANHVYVIPPNKDLSVLRGHLFLFDPLEPSLRMHAIDFFFRSLAEDLREAAVGIVLSGMGSDGAQGLRAIQERAGLILVQDPASARFDSMPRSALEANQADVVASPAALALELLRLVLQGHPDHPRESNISESQKSAFERICILLRDRTGHDFSLYKKSTVYRRIERRMGLHGLDGIGAYAHFLQKNTQETELLFQELLIGITCFFRDPKAWCQLQKEVLPALLMARPPGGHLRAWVAGCSTGEEAYSLAIAFLEVLDGLRLSAPPTLKIFATDLNRDSIAKARQGLFESRALEALSPERLTAWFSLEGRGFRIHKRVREMVVFAPHNLIQDPPFLRLDLVLCRNLLIYLSPELQKRILPLFHYALNPGGTLFLGSAESIGAFSDLLSPTPGKSRIFTRRDAGLPLRAALFPIHLPPRVSREPGMPKPALNLQTLADQALIQRFAPPAVVTTPEGDILYVNGRTGKYLEPAMGKANWNIFAMAREGLRGELPAAFRKAQSHSGPVVLEGLQVGTNGGTQHTDVSVLHLDAPEPLKGMMMVVFTDRPAPAQAKARSLRKSAPELGSRLAELEDELKRRIEELQTTREEMQGAEEELKAANEELQSTNEELQSTNEELTTSKEELQSLNEELQTVNAEQEAKVDELSTLNNDMKNLLEASDIATLFLDEHLSIRRFTQNAARLFKLIPGDVGRPLSDIVTTLDYPDLAGDALGVLQNLQVSEKEVPTRTQDSWYTARILPYRTSQNSIGGVVVTFFDITRAKALEAQLRSIARPR